MARMTTVAEDDLFALRLDRSAPDLWPMLDALYGSHPAYAQFRQDLLSALAEAWKDRPADLKQLDLARDLEPDWFQRADMAGYVFYIDRFAGNLVSGLHARGRDVRAVLHRPAGRYLRPGRGLRGTAAPTPPPVPQGQPGAGLAQPSVDPELVQFTPGVVLFYVCV